MIFEAAAPSFLSSRQGYLISADRVLSAFGYDMSGRADETSDGHRRKSEHELYQCPDVFKGTASSLQKIHNIYGLGIILVEISGWQRIDGNLKVSKGGP